MAEAITILLANSASDILNLDLTAKDRGVERGVVSGRHRQEVRGTEEALLKLASALDDVAVCDNQPQTRRSARESARSIRRQLGV